MSKEKRRVPKLRFPGFTEDWEQCKLGSLASVEMNKRIFKEQTTTNGDIPFYKIGTFGSDADSFISRELFEEYKNKYPYPNIGDILISASGSIGRTVVYNGEDAYFQDSNIVWLNHNGKIDNSFLLQFYNQVKWAGLEGSTIKRLYNKNILETNIALPKIEEQRLIGKFFTLVDSTITLHQRKLEHLNLKKKALLQKLFPKNGECYPELRFPGFTDAWEQRKADYIFKSITDKGYPELPVLSASQELGMVYRNQNGIDIQHDKKNEATYKRVLPGQFVIHLRSFQGGFAYSEVEGITSPAYTVMSFKNSSEQYGLFWKHVFKSETFIKRLETITYGIRDGRSISFSDFKSLILQYPSYSEQKLIEDSIALIERGITLHQRKLDHLQLQKKALLQQMFV